MTANVWKFREAGSSSDGEMLEFEELAEAIQDGSRGIHDQVQGPRDEDWRRIDDHPDLVEFLPWYRSIPVESDESADFVLTPMIDVVLLLILFFMVSASQGIPSVLDSPRFPHDREAASSVTMEELRETHLVVSIDRASQISIQDSPVRSDELVDALECVSRI